MKFTCLVCRKEFEVLRRSKKYLATRKFCNLVCYRKSEIHSRTKFNLGHKPLRNQDGTENSMWKGEKAGYSSIHKWIRSHFGNPIKCTECGTVGVKNKNKWNIHWASKTGKHLRELNDWIGLCAKCHKVQEKTVLKKRLNSKT